MRVSSRRWIGGLMVATLALPAVTGVAVVLVLSAGAAWASTSSAAGSRAAPIEATLLSEPVNGNRGVAPPASSAATSQQVVAYLRVEQQVKAYLQEQADMKFQEYLQVQSYLRDQSYLREQNYLKVASYLKVQAYLTAASQQARLLARAPRMSTVTVGAPPPPTGNPTTANPAPPPNPAAAAMALYWAKQALGKPYKWAGAGPNSFDCSGLTMWAWAHAGVSLPHQSAIQYLETPRVPASSLAPGDLVFYNNGEGPPQPGHVGLYVGNGQMIIADHTGVPVRYASINRNGFMGGGRVR